MSGERWDPSYVRRISGKASEIRGILNAITERAQLAQWDTSAPQRPMMDGSSRDSYAYSDPTGNTATRIEDLLAGVDMSLASVRDELARAKQSLGQWAPAVAATRDDRCACPQGCCPDGCVRPRPEGRSWHDTCRKRRSRAARRGEAWAL